MESFLIITSSLQSWTQKKLICLIARRKFCFIIQSWKDETRFLELFEDFNSYFTEFNNISCFVSNTSIHKFQSFNYLNIFNQYHHYTEIDYAWDCCSSDCLLAMWLWGVTVKTCFSINGRRNAYCLGRPNAAATTFTL